MTKTKKVAGKCAFDGCKTPAKYALYQLSPTFTKVWVQVCDQHDKEIAGENRTLQTLFPKKKWIEQ